MATDEDWEEVYSKLGRPAKPEDYKYSFSEEEINQDQLKNFNETAHRIGLLPKQAERIIKFYNEMNTQAEVDNQKIFEIIIGETIKEREYDVIFENGLPKLSEVQSEEEIIRWDKKPLKIVLKNKSNIGEDNLKLFFKITKNADLLVKCFDIRDEYFGEYNLGNIF